MLLEKDEKRGHVVDHDNPSNLCIRRNRVAQLLAMTARRVDEPPEGFSGGSLRVCCGAGWSRCCLMMKRKKGRRVGERGGFKLDWDWTGSEIERSRKIDS